MLFSVYIWRNPKLRRRVFGTVRVMAYGLVVSAGLTALTVHSAVANVEQESLNLGRKLDGLSDLLQTGYELRLNGQKVFIATSTTDESVTQVLDRFEAHCNKSVAFDPIAWKTLANLKGDEGLRPTGMNRFGVMRTEDPKAGDGVVLCFTSDHAKDFYFALKQFGETGDLHELGDARYVHVKSHTVQDPKTHVAKVETTVQTLWTDGSFNLNTLIGQPDKDTEGSDFATLPRPLSTVRRFTAEAVGTPYAARIYESTATVDQVLDDYNKKMASDDWIAVQSPVVKLPDGRDGRWYTKPQTGEQVILAVTSDGAKTMASVASMGIIEKPPTRPQ